LPHAAPARYQRRVRDNPLQFAVVREDPAIEEAVVDRFGARRALLVASGGCTALSLACGRPSVELSLFDINPHQLAHCEAKREALIAGSRERFNVGGRDPRGLNARGNFESLFRGLRELLVDLVGEDVLAGACEGDRASTETLFASRYWPVAFDLFFSDPMLLAMFGPSAVQHAPPGSYPRYFQRVLEDGLTRAGARDNWFLHHVLLGHYVDRVDALPPYLRELPARVAPWTAIEGSLADVPELARFDVVSLSNLFDWMDRPSVEATIALLGAELAPGAVVIVRQLNSALDLAPLFAPRFDADEVFARELLARDRSLFYARLWIARARKR
jgi:S-adenosylmethionine-diacylglycerol 3-amino-3-carboxypropyl transferase